MMIRAVLVAVMTMAGCGGPPFTLADEVSDGGTFPTPEAAPPGSDRAALPDRPGDDGGAASDARASTVAQSGPEASTPAADASALDAPVFDPVDAGDWDALPICTPFQRPPACRAY